MFINIKVYIDNESREDKVFILSKHRTKEAALKKLLKEIGDAYGWKGLEKEEREQFTEEFLQQFEETGMITMDPEDVFDWLDLWTIKEI